jgi:hypothetical protein
MPSNSTELLPRAPAERGEGGVACFSLPDVLAFRLIVVVPQGTPTNTEQMKILSKNRVFRIISPAPTKPISDFEKFYINLWDAIILPLI